MDARNRELRTKLFKGWSLKKSAAPFRAALCFVFIILELN